VVVYKFQIRRRPPPEGVSARAMDRIAKQLHYELGEMWHREFLPRHFEPGAANRYKYKRRGRKYEEQKERKGLPPLVWTGTLRDLMLSHHVTRPYPTRFSVTMYGPRYAGMRPFKRNAPNLGEEITRMLGTEQKEMMRFAKSRFVQLLDAEKGEAVETVQ
jgi:hypothetical protein